MDEKNILTEILQILRQGGLILYPTDTIWGIGCDATNDVAVQKLIKLKRRTEAKGLVVLVDQLGRLPSYVDEIPDLAWDLIELSDKPLTLVFDRGKNLAPSTYGPNGSIAIRVTQSKFCQQLVSRLGKPIVSSSANFCGMSYPATFGDIRPDIISAVDYVVPQSFDVGSTGKPSSIIAIGKGNLIKVIRD